MTLEEVLAAMKQVKIMAGEQEMTLFSLAQSVAVNLSVTIAELEARSDYNPEIMCEALQVEPDIEDLDEDEDDQQERHNEARRKALREVDEEVEKALDLFRS